MIQIGDKVKRRVSIYDPCAPGHQRTENMDAVVEYIHPERRYYVVRIDVPGDRSYRETMYFNPRSGMY